MTSLALGARLVILIVMAKTAPTPASVPDDVRQADAAIQRGIDHLRHDQYEEALREFLSAYRLAPTPRAIAQIGLANQALGRLADAERRLIEALAATDDRWIRTRRTDLEASLNDIRAHLGSLDVQGSPAGAEIRIAGEAVGALPLRRPLRWPIGTTTVEIGAAGYATTSKTVAIESGRLTVIWVDLLEVRPDIGVAPQPKQIIEHALLAPAQLGQPTSDAPTSTMKAVSWTCLLAGAVLGGTGVALWATKHERLGPGLLAVGSGAVAAGIFGLVLDFGSAPPRRQPTFQAADL